MFTKSPIAAKLDDEILSALAELDALDKDSEKYGTIVDRVSKLHKLKSEEKTQLPSLDTALVVAANIFGILWLTHYEREHVISSKPFGIAMKLPR